MTCATSEPEISELSVKVLLEAAWIIFQSSPLSSESSVDKCNEALPPSPARTSITPFSEAADNTCSLSEFTRTSPVPLGDISICPFESVDDIVFASSLKLSTFSIVSVPRLVIADCAADVTVAAEPDTLPVTSPVTSPVNGPANASEVTVPSKNASLNSNELVPKSTSLSVTGLIAPSAITT